MPFTVKSQNEIYNDLVNYVKYASKNQITDFNVGSVVRSILEAVSLNDSELYLQLAQLKEFNNLNLLVGDDLDERAIEFGLTRLPATPSIASVVFGLSTATVVRQTTLTSSITQGTTPSTITVLDGSQLPSTPGYIVINRGGSSREKVRYTSRSGNTLTLATTNNPWSAGSGGVPAAAAAFAHNVGEIVMFSTLDADTIIPAGTIVSAPASSSRAYDVRFATNTLVTFYDGDVVSLAVTATSLSSGTSQNVPAGSAVFLETIPAGNTDITVTNPLASSNGANIETDVQLRSRIVATIQGRQGGTAIAVEKGALNVTAVVNGGAVTCRLAKLVESLDGVSPSYLYIHDGNNTESTSGFSITYYYKGSEQAPAVLLQNAKLGQRRARVPNWPLLSKPVLYKTAPDGSGTNGVGSGNTLRSVGKSWTSNLWAGGNYYLIDSNGYCSRITSSNTDTVTTVSAPASGLGSGEFTIIDINNPIAEDQIYCNLASGDLELKEASKLLATEWLVSWSDPTDSNSVAFTYYGGLAAEVQRVISGDSTDPGSYPGIAALGSIVSVRVPNVHSVGVTVSITTVVGVQETTELRDLVKKAITAYVSTLNIGDSFILSEAIARCQRVPGVFDTRFVTPTSNVSVLSNELFRVHGDVLVQ